VRPHCRGEKAGTAAGLPKKKARPKRVELAEACAWVHAKGRVLLELQTGSRWRGLWKLPLLPSAPDAEPVLTAQYPFTHHRVTLSVFSQPPPRMVGESQAWHPVDTLPDLALTAPHRRAIEALLGLKS
jgi:A/G-specific adenine glycosylase